MRNYRDLQTWTKAHTLTLELYKLSRQFPKEEMYGLTSQLRRAASSIGANDVVASPIQSLQDS
jgi:four helix bundle protein